MSLDLSRLTIPKGSRKVRRRLARGEGSGRGKTSGRGGKGQTARSGGTIKAGFEGGQMPLYRRISKLGFVSRQRVSGRNRFVTVNIGELERFSAGATVTSKEILEGGFGRRKKPQAGVKLLGGGKLTKKLHLKVDGVTESARKAVESLGGTVEVA